MLVHVVCKGGPACGSSAHRWRGGASERMPRCSTGWRLARAASRGAAGRSAERWPRAAGPPLRGLSRRRAPDLARRAAGAAPPELHARHHPHGAGAGGAGRRRGGAGSLAIRGAAGRAGRMGMLATAVPSTWEQTKKNKRRADLGRHLHQRAERHARRGGAAHQEHPARGARGGGVGAERGRAGCALPAALSRTNVAVHHSQGAEGQHQQAPAARVDALQAGAGRAVAGVVAPARRRRRAAPRGLLPVACCSAELARHPERLSNRPPRAASAPHAHGPPRRSHLVLGPLYALL